MMSSASPLMYVAGSGIRQHGWKQRIPSVPAAVISMWMHDLGAKRKPRGPIAAKDAFSVRSQPLALTTRWF